MKIYQFITTCLLIFTFLGCADNDDSYDFFIVGHAYGHPQGLNRGLHPAFVNQIDFINNEKSIELGIFTGDILRCRRPVCVDRVKQQLSLLDMPVHIAPGNHDLYQNFETDFNDYFYSFVHKGDLFIILSPGLDNWNITNNQLTFLEKTLANNKETTRRAFVFMHELIWWSPEEYPEIKINYAENYPGETNFGTQIMPLLLSFQKRVYLFAGDLGCTKYVSQYMMQDTANITLMASGIGSNTKEYYLRVKVSHENPTIELISLNNSTKMPNIKSVKLVNKTYNYF